MRIPSWSVLFFICRHNSEIKASCPNFIGIVSKGQKGEQSDMKVGIIGGGKVGSCLAVYLKDAGYLAAITAATTEHSNRLAQKFAVPLCTNKEVAELSEVILLTVPDRLIAETAAAIADAGAGLQHKVFLHCSGSLGLEPLQCLAKAGAHVGSLHPLQSFAGGKADLEGVYMAVDGDAEALLAAEQLASVLGGVSFHVPAAERAAYHAAACICSNYAVAVEALAQKLMSRWTGSDEAAWKALLPLFKGTAANLLGTEQPGAVLTGPIARGDAATVAKHLEVLPSELKHVYCSLGLAAVQLALANGTIDWETKQQLEELLGQSEVQNDR